MKFDFSQYKDPTGHLTVPSDEDLGFFGHAGDIAMAPIRGVAGAGEAIYDLADWALMDWLPDAEDNFGLGHSKTLAGGLVQGISQFMVGFVPGLGAASWAGRGLGIASKVGKMSSAAKAAGQAKKATAIQWGASFGRSVTAGAVADFAVFDAQEARLSNLLQQFPALQNPVSEFLAADEDDTEVEGRLKNLMEGGILGGMMEPFVMGLKALRAARKARQGGMTPDEAAEVAMEKSGLRSQTQDISRSLGVSDTEATGLNALSRTLLGKGADEIDWVRGVDNEGNAVKGSVEFREDGRAIISGFESADVSTGIHEIAHVARRRLLSREVPEEGRLGITDRNIEVTERWAGVTDGKWTVEAEEKFARGFEKYLLDGKAPNKGVKALFDKLASWMNSIYKQVDGSPVDVRISPEMKEVFDNLMKRGDLPDLPAPKVGTGPRVLHQTGDPSTGAPRPPKHEHINLDRVSSADATRTVVAAMKEGDYSRLVTRETLSDADLAADVNPHTADIAHMLGEADPGDLTQILREHGDAGRQFIYRQAAIRDHADRLANQAAEAVEANIRTGNESDLVHAEQLIRMSEEFLIAAREGGTAAGQLLQAQRRTAGIETMPTPKAPEAPPISGRGTDEGTGTGTGRGTGEETGTGTGRGTGEGTLETLDRILSEEMYRPDTPEAAQVRGDYFEAIGGGDRDRGVKIVRERVARWKAVKDAQGSLAAMKAAPDFATKPQMLVEYWLNSILSGPLTQLVNATSNTANTLFLPFERALGQAATLHFGEAAKELSFYAHLGSQLKDAMTAATAAFKNWGDPLDPLTAIDTTKGGGYNRALSARNLGKSPDDVGGAAIDWIGKALNLPSRLLLSSDSFFKHLNYRATVRAGLFREGAEAGLTGRALAGYVEEGLQTMIKDGQHYTYKNVRMAAERGARAKFGHMENGEEKTKAIQSHILKYMNDNWDQYVDEGGTNSRSLLANKALHYGREVTYTQSLTDPNRATLVKAAGKWNDLVNHAPIFRLVTPFVRTPTNLISFFLNRSVGAYADLAKIGVRKVRHMKAANKEVAEAMSKKGPELHDVLGRISTGAMFFYGASMAFSSGALTGGGPRDPNRRRLLESQGWQPYSIRVGDEWYSYRRLDPFASFFGTVADIAEAMAEAPPEDRGTLEALMGSVIISAAKNITNKSYLTGMARTTNMLSDPERFGGSYWKQTVASLAPFSSFFGQTTGSSEHQMEIRGALDAVRAKYGLTGDSVIDFDAQVEARRNIFGKKIERPTMGATVQFGIPPFMWGHYTQIKDDFVLDELNQLGHGFSPPSKVVNEINTAQHVNSAGQSFYDRWQEQHGSVRIGGKTLKQAMKALMKSRSYQRLSYDHFEGNKSPRIGEVQKLIRKYRARAFQMTLREFPEVNALYKRNSQIKAYRKAGRDIQSLLDY